MSASSRRSRRVSSAATRSAEASSCASLGEASAGLPSGVPARTRVPPARAGGRGRVGACPGRRRRRAWAHRAAPRIGCRGRARPTRISAMSPTGKAFYVTTPIYYVNDAPHIGHAYTTRRGRHDLPLAPPARRGRLVPDRHRRARREGPAHGRGRRGHAAGSGPTGSSPSTGSPSWRPSTSPTTTSSAPPSGVTRRASSTS